MPDSLPPDETEQLLRGADGPRPLPPDLRRRLAEQLLAPAAARPLPGSLRSRLEQALPSRADRRWRWVRPASAAAAVVLVAAVAGIALHGGTPNRAVTTATSGSVRNAAGQRSAVAGSVGALEAGSGTAGSTSAGATASGAGGAGGSASSGTASSASGAGATAGSPTPAPAQPPSPPGPPPAVSGVSPASGPTAGGTWVTVTGSNLTGTTAVRFGTTAVSQLMVLSATEVRALSPAHQVGPVDVTVVTPSGTSPAVLNDRYTFVP